MKMLYPFIERYRRLFFITLSAIALVIFNSTAFFLQKNSDVIGGGINRSFFFLLINVHLILVAFILYIIVKQSVKLVVDYRRKTPGSGFKRNLFFAFVFFSVLPSSFVLVVAGKFLFASIDKWFHVQVGQGLESGLLLHQAYTVQERTIIKSEKSNPAIVEYHWSYKDQSRYRAMLIAESMVWRSYRERNDRTIKSLRKLFIQELRSIRLGEDKTFDFYGSLYRVMRNQDTYTLKVMRYPDEIRKPLVTLQNSIYDAMQLKSMQQSIYSTYIFTFILFACFILLLSIWCAFYLAKGISTPIQELLKATDIIKKGSWDVVVKHDGNHDLKPLAIGFNEMIKVVKQKQEELSTILEHINDSVLYINRFGRIITYNKAAQKLIASIVPDRVIKQKKITFLPEEVRNVFFQVVRAFMLSHKFQLSREIAITINHEYRIFMIHLSAVEGAYVANTTSAKALLMVIQDITKIVKLSKTQAWQEAAKQVAHEIKNPLTPIQLATQRLQRKFGALFAGEPAFIDCTQTILAQVEVIKNLASHFSKFASMPGVTIALVDIVQLVRESVRLYEFSYPDVRFFIEHNDASIMIKTDQEKIKQVMVNLLDNSMRAFFQSNNNYGNKEINISITIDKKRSVIIILIADNGPGIDLSVKENLFMPYVSTTQKNMGLGLAIVHDSIKQLGGSIRLVPSSVGAVFEIVLLYH